MSGERSRDNLGGLNENRINQVTKKDANISEGIQEEEQNIIVELKKS